ncbi:MAG: response regulator [Micavibrio aeruginosavorus]|uniref:Response regulator n=1 Tax=Micavibrio aeruginosavorus TaxID=349221 RepID=A0A7T5UGU8_9BACT|nr:MAG: response regulator [Micavibrio aeruginosavorus]
MQNLASANPEELPHILIVDDDERIRSLLLRYLQENGFLVVAAASAAEADEILARFLFDALVVDIMMPGETGLSFTRRFKDEHDTPVLLLTALGETDDKISGFENGADDYLSKPFEPRELVLRLQAILRRRPKPRGLKTFRVGRWLYDESVNELQDGQETIRLTTVEANLLRALASRAGEVISREDLAALCDLDAGERTIDVQVTRLRRKLEDDVKRPRCLKTVRGRGYMLRIENE